MMRRTFVLVFTILTVSSFRNTLLAQTARVKDDSVSVGRRPFNPKLNPLYIIDGDFSIGMTTLNPNDIESINIYKDKTAFDKYHNLGSYGVVSIKTKHRSDTIYKLTLDSALQRRHLFVIDGVPVDSLRNITPYDVFQIKVLDGQKASNLTFDSPSDVILIVTKKSAKYIYQKQFGKRSGQYRRYLKKNNGADDAVSYIVDHKIIEPGMAADEKLKILAKLADKQIKAVKFVYESGRGLPATLNVPVVVIETNEQHPKL